MSWLVIGAGISGIAAANYLKSKNYDVKISDLKEPKSELKSKLFSDIQLIIGEQTTALLNGISNIILSPGIPQTVPLIQEALSRNINVMSELDLALPDYKGTLIAVTGTNGKSTTCAMINHILNESGNSCVIGGNFGDPPSMILLEGRQKDFMVVEVSSYQLELSKHINPIVSVITSFSEDHLKRHGTLENYFKTKWRLFEATSYDGTVITTQNIVDCAKMYEAPLSNIPQVTITDDLNSSFALAACSYVTKIPVNMLQQYLTTFRALEHRCEFVREFNGYSIINDSKATNVESVLFALKNLTEKTCILLLGGQGKGESFEPILQLFKHNISHVMCFGESCLKISAVFQNHLPCTTYQTLAQTLQELPRLLSTTPDTVLFSPGCASFDEFNNFEERGRFFKTKVQAM